MSIRWTPYGETRYRQIGNLIRWTFFLDHRSYLRKGLDHQELINIMIYIRPVLNIHRNFNDCLRYMSAKLVFSLEILLSPIHINPNFKFLISQISSKAWRVTRKILKLVVATGKEEILSIIQAHNNILPISKFCSIWSTI